MRLYNRYIAKSLFMPVIVITLTLTGIIWLTYSLRYIDWIVNRGLDVSTFLYVSMLLLPLFLFLTLPVALFCSVLHIYNKLISDSELIILKSSGLSRMGVASPAFVVAAFVTLLSYAISLYILPNYYREFKDMEVFIRNTYASVALQEGVFNSPHKGLTVYIESRQKDGLLGGILVHDEKDIEQPVTLIAEYGKIVEGTNGPKLELFNGNMQEVNKKSFLYFDSYSFDLSHYTDISTVRSREAEERYIHELIFTDETNEKLRGKFIAEGHHRIVWPLFGFMLTLIALAAILSGQFNRRGQWKRILTATFITVIAAVSDLTLKNMVASRIYLWPLMYINILFFAGISLHILASNKVINNILPKINYAK